jgi:hypothetical protein
VSLPTHIFASNGDTEQLGGGEATEATNIVLQSLPGWGTLSVQLEGSNDGATWVLLTGQNLNTGGAFTVFNSGGLLARFDVSGLAYVRARVTAFTSGTGQLQWGSGTQGARV